MTRRDDLVARRAKATPPGEDEAEVLKRRAEAHRVLRLERGAEAARYSRSAASAAIRPSVEFADVDEWRAFLAPLYPAWAVEIGVGLFDSPSWVVLEVDEPPRRRWRPDAAKLDLKFAAEGGFVDADGLWKIDPGEPLGQIPPPPKPRRPSARDRLRVIGDGALPKPTRTATRRKS